VCDVYFWYSNNLSRFPDGKDEPLPNRDVKIAAIEPMVDVLFYFITF